MKFIPVINDHYWNSKNNVDTNNSYNYVKDLEDANQQLREENLKLRKEIERLRWILTEQD
jgi:ABC-type oligopeptide transport system substrate-binding subunit